MRKGAPTVRSQVLYPALAKGAHERKVILLQGVSGVNSLSKNPLFHPENVGCLRGVCISFGLLLESVQKALTHLGPINGSGATERPFYLTVTGS